MNNKEIKKITKKALATGAIATLLASGSPEAVQATTNDIEQDNSLKQEQTSEDELVCTSKPFPTKEEAKEWLNQAEKNISDDYKVTDKGIIERNSSVTKTEQVTVDEEFDTRDEAENKKAEIENGDNKKVNLEIIEDKKEVEVTKKVEVNETFKTEEEALAFIEKYKDKNNVSLEIEKIYSEWISQGIIKVDEFTGLTEQERDDRVNRTVAELKKDENATLKYVITIEKTSKKEFVFDKEVKTTETKTFATLEEANAYIKKLQLMENENIKITISAPKEIKTFIPTTSESFSGEFSTLEELEAFLKELENQNFNLKDIEKSESKTSSIIKVPTGNITINHSSKLESQGRYKLTADYLLIKQANGNVAIWTKEELTKEEQKQLKEAYLNNNYDPSIKPNFNFNFISGEGSKDLSYIGNGWGTYNFAIEEEKIIMTCSKDKISHLDYGTITKEYKEEKQEIIKYLVSGTKETGSYETKYELTSEIAEKLFKEVILYGAEIKKETFTRDEIIKVIGSYDELSKEEQIKYRLLGTYLKTINEKEYIAYIKAIEKLNERGVQTGDDSNIKYALMGLGLSIAGLGYALSSNQRTRKRD